MIKPTVRKSWTTGFWHICFGPTYHQNWYTTWDRAYSDARRIAKESAWR